MLEELTEREKEVLRLRFGLKTATLHLEEVGRRFGVTRERIRQIEAKALGSSGTQQEQKAQGLSRLRSRKALPQ